MIRQLLILPFIFLATGCASDYAHRYTSTGEPTTYQERYPIDVREKEHILDIPVSAKAGRLSTTDEKKIMSFANEFLQHRISALSILVPIHSSNSATAAQISHDIITRLSGSGGVLSRHHLRLLEYDASKHRGNIPIRLSYHSVTTHTKECGKWNDLSNTYENQNNLNFGCATQHNLAAMLQNPQDLLRPRTTTHIDAARRSKVIDDYRNAAETNTPDDSYDAIDRVEF